MSSRVKFLIGLVSFAFVMRVLPRLLTAGFVEDDPYVLFYPWNFMPLTAVCLYAGAYFSDRRLSFGLPLLAIVLSDLAIGIASGKPEWGFAPDRWSAYLCYPLVIMMGTGLSRRTWPLRAIDAAARGVLAEALFFLVSNFGYFVGQTDLPHTLAGLLTCYIQAIPFVAKAFASTAFYSVLLFSPLAVRAAGGAPTVPSPQPTGSSRSRSSPGHPAEAPIVPTLQSTGASRSAPATQQPATHQSALSTSAVPVND